MRKDKGWDKAWGDMPEWAKDIHQGVYQPAPWTVIAETADFAVVWVRGHTAYLNRGMTSYAETEYMLLHKWSNWSGQYGIFKRLGMQQVLRSGRLKRGDRERFAGVLEQAQALHNQERSSNE